MTNKAIRTAKPFVFAACLVPYIMLVQRFRADNLGADPVNTITHFTGNWAIYFLLVSLAITPVRRLSPKLAWLIRFRRMLGLFAFFYATLHLAVYVFLFSGFDLPGALANLRQHHFAAVGQQWLEVWPTMVDDAEKRRFIQVGLASYLILLALAVTSPQAIMRRLGGKPWQRLHRLVYLAAILGTVHYWWLVKPGNREPWKDTLALAVLLMARVVYVVAKRRRMPAPARSA